MPFKSTLYLLSIKPLGKNANLYSAFILEIGSMALYSGNFRRMKKSVFLLIILLIATQYSLFSQSYSLLSEASFNEPVLNSGVLKTRKTFLLNTSELKRLTNEAPETLTLSIPTSNGANFQVSLQKRNILAAGFSVKTADGSTESLDYGVHYGGKLANDPRSLVAFSFYKNCLFGMIATDAGNFNLVFLRDENKNPSQRYVLYNDRDLTIPNTFKCGSDYLPPISKKEQHYSEKSGGSSCRMLTQYWECDYRMYQDNGSSVQNTVSWVTGMFNVMAYIYHNEMINIQISEIYVWNTPDPYTDDAGAALTEFGDARQNNFNGDIAHFVTTLTTGNGGLAWLDVICADYSSDWSYGPYAYSNIDDAFSNLPLWSWTINVVTHETGHNLGSPHTQWCGWEIAPNVHAAIDSCYQTEDYEGVVCYSGPDIGRTGTIMSYCHLTGNVNLNLGFGPLPGNLIRQRFNDAPCLTTYPGPATPTVTGQIQYCVHDQIELTATSTDGTVSWIGPNGFTSSSGSISIANAQPSNAGVYKASVTVGNCTSSELVNVEVNIKPSNPNIVQNGNSLKCYPNAPLFTYQWFDANNNLVGTGQTFTPSASGEYHVIVYRNGCASNASSAYSFTLISYAGIGENPADNAVQVWPNPASTHISVSYKNPSNTSASLSIFDLSGRLVYQKNITNTEASQIDVSYLSGGLYILELNSGEQKNRVKFLVEN